MRKMKNRYLTKTKRVLRDVYMIYVVLGSLYALGDYNTGHISSDIHLGLKSPTVLEQRILDFAKERFDVEN